MMRSTWAEIDVDAIEHNVRGLAAAAAPAEVCAVVKANGYGHGAVAAAQAALRGGATWLAVAFVDEGAELRAAGIDAPVLVLSEPRPPEMLVAARAALQLAVYSAAGIVAANRAALAVGVTMAVHLKIDTGMHRVGVAPDGAVDLADLIAAQPALTLASVWTHCAVADEPGDPFTAEQLDRFARARVAIAARGHAAPLAHAANSAGALAHPQARLDLVRCGIAIYGIAPSRALDGVADLRPALRLRSEIGHVQHLAPGDTVSYGRRWRAEAPTRVATVPLGYADGVRRSYGLDGGVVLIGGVRCAVLGIVTMDQLLVDISAVPDAAVGDEVVLIGRQGTEVITANDVADVLGTIGYEVTCGISARVPRRYVGGGVNP